MVATTIAYDISARKKILCVEEQEDSRLMLTMLLERKGYEVVTATTPAEAWRLAQLHSFDLYILETRFPGGSGIELCQQIRAFDSQTPILFYSTAAYDKDITAGLAAGAQRYLIKPLDIYIIEEVIEKQLAYTQGYFIPSYVSTSEQL